MTATHCEENQKQQYLPQYQTEGAACADLVACIPPNLVDHVNIGSSVKLGFRSLVVVGTGVAMEIPEGFKLCIAARSGLAKRGIFMTNAPAQIDSDFRGEIQVIIANFSHEIITIKDGERFAQCWIEPVHKMNWEVVDQISETVRGENGFGSTGE